MGGVLPVSWRVMALWFLIASNLVFPRTPWTAPYAGREVEISHPLLESDFTLRQAIPLAAVAAVAAGELSR